MKKYIYSLLAILTISLCSAQVVSLSQAEYFWDTDPGEGNGTIITASDGSFNSAFEKIAVSGLGAPSVGLHKFCVRVKDNLGIWSPVVTNVIKVESTTTPTPVSLTQAEYFWDTDPGEGSATPLLAIDGNFNSAFEKAAVTGLNAPSVGLHKFSIRVKDNQGIWSPAFTNIVNVGATTSPIPVSLSQAEYFWDTDPGEGNAIPLLATDGNFNSAFEKVAVTGLNAPSVGMHKFSIRIKDNQGVWSPVFTNIVNVELTTTPTPISLSQAEYFWDTDPGEGSGTAFLATDGNFDSAFEKIQKTAIPIVNPVGLHIFNVRVKDNSGVWSPVFKNAIYIETLLANNTFTFTKVIVYPNPVKDILNLSFDKEITNVSIHTLLGQEVLNKDMNTNEGTIDTSNLVSGTYLVKVTSNDGIKTLKIIKE
jgi:Secretion system C-terminal sorting domain